VMVMRIEGEVFKEQFQDQAFEEGKYSLWFPCYQAICNHLYTYACVKMINPKDMPRNT
jgi:hypothetical protein